MGFRGFLLSTGLGAAGGFVAGKRYGPATARTPLPAPVKRLLGRATGGEVERLVHIARIRAGTEAELHQFIEADFPAQAVAACADLLQVTHFIGSSYLVTEYVYRGEFAPVFRAFRANPDVEGYFAALGLLLDEVPAPSPDTPARQALAAQGLRWNREQGVQRTPLLRSKEASTDAVERGSVLTPS